MKLNEPLKEKKITFFSWIICEPKAFQVIFTMSMIVGLVISVGLTFCAWYFKWMVEVAVIISIFAVLNIYNTLKNFKNIKYTGMSINDMVYSGKYKPKKRGKKK